jgi:hypothetical protein
VQEAALSKAARRDDKAAVLATSLSQCSEALQLQVPSRRHFLWSRFNLPSERDYRQHMKPLCLPA